jgi:TRAP-type C4-dicarboxylate transport system permease small subunit
MLRKLKISVAALNRGMFIIAGITLICVMLLTVIDVTLRYFGHPIIGVYDIVACSGLFIIGFSLPLAAERTAHV